MVFLKNVVPAIVSTFKYDSKSAPATAKSEAQSSP